MPDTSEYGTYQALKAIHYFRDDADVDYYELYDLQTDPNELHNIYGQKGTEAITRQLMKRLRQYRRELRVDE